MTTAKKRVRFSFIGRARKSQSTFCAGPKEETPECALDPDADGCDNPFTGFYLPEAAKDSRSLNRFKRAMLFINDS